MLAQASEGRTRANAALSSQPRSSMSRLAERAGSCFVTTTIARSPSTALPIAEQSGHYVGADTSAARDSFRTNSVMPRPQLPATGNAPVAESRARVAGNESVHLHRWQGRLGCLSARASPGSPEGSIRRDPILARAFARVQRVPLTFDSNGHCCVAARRMPGRRQSRARPKSRVNCGAPRLRSARALAVSP